MSTKPPFIIRDMRRYDRDPDYPEALINLIDALRAYIKVDMAIGDDLLREGSITRKEYDKGMIETKQLMMVLRNLEGHEFDPTLNGVLKEKK